VAEGVPGISCAVLFCEIRQPTEIANRRQARKFRIRL